MDYFRLVIMHGQDSSRVGSGVLQRAANLVGTCVYISETTACEERSFRSVEFLECAVCFWLLHKFFIQKLPL